MKSTKKRGTIRGISVFNEYLYPFLVPIYTPFMAKTQYNKKLLTKSGIESFKPKSKQYKKSDSDGLYLLIHPNGSKYWRMKYILFGKEKTYSIGKYPDISLSHAREARNEAKRLINKGIDPTQDRIRQKQEVEKQATGTFKKIALQWHQHKTKYDWKANNSREILSAMERELFPHIGSMPVKDITTRTLKRVLKRVENRGSLELLRKLKQWCVNIFNLAIEDEHIQHNPATVITIPKRTKKNFNCIELEEFPKLIRDIRNYGGDLVIKYAIQLTLLTALRTEELRKAEWKEIDFENKLWTIPAQRLKWWRKYKDVDKVHIVPLSKQAIELFRKLQEINGHRKYVFASLVKPTQAVANNSMLFTLYRLGYAQRMTIHSFRRLFSTSANDAGKNRDHIEAALCHRLETSVHSVYNKSTYVEQRKGLMQWWADHIDRQVTKSDVIPIDKVKKN